MIALLLMLAAAQGDAADGSNQSVAAAQSGYPSPKGLILGVDANADAVPQAAPGPGWPEAAILRRDAVTGEAWQFGFDAALRFEAGVATSDTEFYLVSGSARIGGQMLGPGDYLRIGQGGVLGTLEAQANTKLLMFRNPPGEVGKEPLQIYVHGDDVPWAVGTVAKEAGAKAPLMIRRLYTDPVTGARTHLVRLAAGVSVPWEIHSTAEEGYLLEGDYHLAECLPDGRRDYDYDEGGYFYRPASLIHSGPQSTSKTGATWLIRTPRTLDAVFYAACPSPLANKEKTP